MCEHPPPTHTHSMYTHVHTHIHLDHHMKHTQGSSQLPQKKQLGITSRLLRGKVDSKVMFMYLLEHSFNWTSPEACNITLQNSARFLFLELKVTFSSHLVTLVVQSGFFVLCFMFFQEKRRHSMYSRYKMIQNRG